MTVAFGNLIAMGISGSELFKGKPALEFFVYAILMGIVMVFFVLVAWRFKFKETDSEKIRKKEKEKKSEAK